MLKVLRLRIRLTAPDGDTIGVGDQGQGVGPCVYRGWRRLLLSRLPEAGGRRRHTYLPELSLLVL